MTPEGALKATCRAIAKKRGLVFWSIDGKGINGIPDTLCGRTDPTAGVAFVEFKRPDGKGVISAQQYKRVDELTRAGSDAFFCKSVQEYLDIIEGRTL